MPQYAPLYPRRGGTPQGGSIYMFNRRRPPRKTSTLGDLGGPIPGGTPPAGSSGFPFGGEGTDIVGTGTTSAPAQKPFDYQAILSSDPYWAQTQANMKAASIADKAQRDAAIQRALISYGSVPSLNLSGLSSGDLGSIITGTVRDLAAKNTASGLSQLARMQDAYGKTLDATKSNIGAAGMFRSGQTGFALGNVEMDYKRQQSDSLNQLLDYISGAQQGWLGAEQSRQAQLEQAYMDAAQRAYDQWSIWQQGNDETTTTTRGPTYPGGASEPDYGPNPRGKRRYRTPTGGSYLRVPTSTGW